MKKFIVIMICIGLGSASQAATLTLNLKCLIQGYYSEGGSMVPAAENQGCVWAGQGMTDRVQIYLRKGAYPYSIVGTAVVNLPTSGQVVANITHTNLHSGSYYIVVKNSFNALETWSAAPVAFTEGQTTNYDFTDHAEKAYGKNMYKITDPGNGTDYYCFYSGDVNHDGNIDLLDETQLENDILDFAYGCVPTDLNGDGNVDILDQAIFETNGPGLFIHVKSPLVGSKATPKQQANISALASNVDVDVSPNPSTSHVNVHFKTTSIQGTVKLQLADLSGRLILEYDSTCSGDCIERIELPASTGAGLYMLRVLEDGRTVAVKKIIVSQ